MLKFIFSFIFFGLLFYGMYVYTPDAFHLLESWAAVIYKYAASLVHQFIPAATPPAS